MSEGGTADVGVAATLSVRLLQLDIQSGVSTCTSSVRGKDDDGFAFGSVGTFKVKTSTIGRCGASITGSKPRVMIV